VHIIPEKPLVKFGKSIVLECVTKPVVHESIKWTFYNYSLPSNAKAIGHFLIVTDASLANAGVYVCNVTTPSSIFTAEVPLVVEPDDQYDTGDYLPNIQRENDDFVIVQDENYVSKAYSLNSQKDNYVFVIILNIALIIMAILK